MTHCKRLVFLLLALALLRPSGVHAESIDALFLSVVDGDSLRVEYKYDAMEVRLIGVDAPEFGQEYGVDAKTFALRFCYRKTLRLEFDKEKKDRYGRFLAYVYVGDKMLNEELVRAGLAIPVKIKPNTRHYDRLKGAEKMARDNMRGFWARGGLKQTPAQWRKDHPRK